MLLSMAGQADNRRRLAADILLLALAYVASGFLVRLSGAASALFASAVWPPACTALAVLPVHATSDNT